MLKTKYNNITTKKNMKYQPDQDKKKKLSFTQAAKVCQSCQTDREQKACFVRRGKGGVRIQDLRYWVERTDLWYFPCQNQSEFLNRFQMIFLGFRFSIISTWVIIIQWRLYWLVIWTDSQDENWSKSVGYIRGHSWISDAFTSVGTSNLKFCCTFFCRDIFISLLKNIFK